jgi:hypothetical protein
MKLLIKKENMKNKLYSITEDLEQRNPGKKFYSFQDMEDAEIRKKEVILPLPKKYFNKIVKLIKGEK